MKQYNQGRFNILAFGKQHVITNGIFKNHIPISHDLSEVTSCLLKASSMVSPTPAESHVKLYHTLEQGLYIPVPK